MAERMEHEEEEKLWERLKSYLTGKEISEYGGRVRRCVNIVSLMTLGACRVTKACSVSHSSCKRAADGAFSFIVEICHLYMKGSG